MPKRGSPDSGVPRHPGNRAHAVARGPRDRRSYSPPRRRRPPRDGERQCGFGARHRLDHRRPRTPPRGAAARALRRMSAALFLLLLTAAQGDTGSFVIRNFRFASGESLPELRLHYRTLGHPRRDAVLILHGTGGSGDQFLSPLFAGELYGPGQPLDTSSHYLILPDNIGHGRSSKPSDGLRSRFPHYAYEDMVAAQYRLVTEGLRVNHLLLVMGTSMGCMQSLLWGEGLPEFMDGLVPLACLPTQIAGRNRMWRKLIIDDITGDPDWKNGDYATQPRGLRAALQLLFIAGSAPLVQQRLVPAPDPADAYLSRWIETRLAETDANDLLYQVAASRDYDPSGALERVTVPVLAINSADDFINPPELGIMERLITRAKQARYVLIPISDKTRGHGTHTVAATWKEYFAPFVASLERR